MNIKAFFKRSSIVYYTMLSIISVSVILLISFFVYTAEKKSTINNLQTSEQNKLDLQIHEIINDFTFVERDVLLLRYLVALVDKYSYVNGKAFDLLKDEFYQYIKQKGIYDQIRFIDQHGMEVIRVNYCSGKPEIVDDQFLQNKANRYYFQELKNLSDHVLYFSKFDLNVENGKIEVPYKPVLRIGTRTMNCEEDFCGIVIVNYLVEDLIQRIKALNVNYLSSTHVLEPNGYFLISPNQENNWGFMFEDRKDKTYASIYPDAWNIVHNNKKGQFFTPDGLYTFKTLAFHQIAKNVNEDNLDYYATDDYWKVISYISDDKIKNLEKEILARFTIPVILLISLSIILSFILTYLKIREHHSKNLIIEKNDFFSNVINSISEPLYVICPKSFDIHMANQEANLYLIKEGSNFRENTLIKDQETKIMLKEFRKKVVTSKKHKHIEIKIPKDNNTINFFDINGYPILDKNSEVSLIIEVVNNITEEKVSEQKFRDLLASAPDGMIITNSNGEIKMVNNQAEKMFGYLTEDLIDRKIEILIPKRLTQHAMHRDKFLKNPQKRAMGAGRELVGLRKNGEEFPVEISLSPIQTNEGLLISSAIRDITDRRIAEQKLMESEQKFRALFDNQSQFIGLLEIDGTIIEVNETALDFGGFSLEKIRGKKFWEAPWWTLSDKTSLELKNAIKVAANGKYVRYEVEVAGKNNETLTVDFSLQPVKDEKGNVILLIPEAKDITERKNIERALKTSEKQLKYYVKHTPNAVAMFDTNMRYLVVSDRWYKDYNLKDKNIIGKIHYDVFPEIKDIEIRKNYHRRSLNGEILKVDEYKLVREDGSINWLRYEIHPWYTDNNQIGGIIMYTEEITERKKIEEAVFEQAQILNQIAESVVTTDMNGFITMWNRGAEELFGYTKSEMLGEHISRLYPKEEHSFLENQVIKPLIKKGRHVTEVKMQKKSGNKFIGRLSYSLKKDKNDVVVGMIGSTIDITQSKKDRLEIEQKQLMLSEAQKIAHLGSWEWDIKKDEINWSDELYNIFEIKKNEFKPNLSTYFEFLSEEDAISLGNAIQDSLDTKTGFHIEHKVKLPNGKIKYIDGIANVQLDKNEEVKQFYGTALDITTRKNAELEIKKLNENLEQKVKDRTKKLEKAYGEVAASKEEAEKANKTKSEFLANMSHEIRTPLNAVIGFSEILSKQIVDPIQKDFVDSIRSSGKTLLGLINDILDLSKIEVGKLELQPEPVSIENLIQYLKSLFEVRIKERDLKLIIDIHDDLPKYIVIDELRIKQVLINLLGNAVKFTHKGFVKLSIKPVNKFKSKVNLEISIEDSGIGINKNNQEKIFDAFHQKEGQNTKKYGGTGLGLAISNKILNLMNSEVRVESKINKGSKFYFTLKNIEIFKGEPDSKIKFDPDEIVFEGSKVLVVDDIEKNRELIRNFLKYHNLQVYEASDGETSIKIAQEILPDFIFLDMRMPGLDGYQTLKELRKNPGLKNTPVVAITATVHLDKALLLGKGGFNGIINKPIELSDIISVLTVHLPYEKVEIQHKKAQKDIVNLEKISLTPGLIDNFKQDIAPLIKSLEKRKSNSVITELYDKIIKTGDNFEVEELVSFGKEMSVSARSFNIIKTYKMIDRLVDYYYKFIN